MFRFRFQSLLRHRKHLERICQRELAAVRAALQIEEQKIKRFLAQKTKQQQQMQHKQNGRHTAAEIKLYQNYLQRLDQDIERQQQRVLEVKTEFEKKRSNLKEAMRQRKIMERLKENNRLKYHREQVKKERDLMDEVAARRHYRNNPI